ncbi:unnamed protein product [Dracunculus medinensis]|uniref:FLYWCH-type domain-containing protein n=1 Tax=Dracunculus medinensis TaxID=318479 RepID=A0A0N4U8Y3_DRAME|nr:unnamed protein product [Dracunculus medinensis]
MSVVACQQTGYYMEKKLGSRKYRKSATGLSCQLQILSRPEKLEYVHEHPNNSSKTPTSREGYHSTRLLRPFVNLQVHNIVMHPDGTKLNKS